MRDRETDKQTDRDRQTQRETGRENSNLKTLMVKDSTIRFF